MNLETITHQAKLECLDNRATMFVYLRWVVNIRKEKKLSNLIFLNDLSRTVRCLKKQML